MKNLRRIKNLSVLLFTLWMILLPLSVQAEFVPISQNENDQDLQEEQQDIEIVIDESLVDEEEDNGETEVTIVDESTTKSSNIYFDLTLERGDQTPFGNYIPYTLTVTPHIDSPRTQILWNVPSTLEALPRHEEFVSMQRGQEYILEGRIRPLKEGTYDFSISVIAWQHNTNFTNSVSDNVTLNRNLVLQPVSSNYQILNTLRWVGIGLLFIGIIVISVVLVKKYMKKAKDWLTPPT